MQQKNLINQWFDYFVQKKSAKVWGGQKFLLFETKFVTLKSKMILSI